MAEWQNGRMEEWHGVELRSLCVAWVYNHNPGLQRVLMVWNSAESDTLFAKCYEEEV